MPIPASKIYGNLRRRLLLRGTNLRQWALERGLPVGSVYNCVKGDRNGVEAIRIRAELEKFLKETPTRRVKPNKGHAKPSATRSFIRRDTDKTSDSQVLSLYSEPPALRNLHD